MDYSLGFYILLLSIIFACLINYYYMVQDFSRQIANFFIISLITAVIITYTNKYQKIPLIEILRYTCIIFFILLLIYILSLGYKILVSERMDTLRSFMVLFTFFIILVIVYIIGSPIWSNTV